PRRGPPSPDGTDVEPDVASERCRRANDQGDLMHVGGRASRHCWIVWAPCTPTDFGPAAHFARATALSMSSVTNWTDEPGRGQPSGTWWVTTNAGTSHGCWPKAGHGPAQIG